MWAKILEDKYNLHFIIQMCIFKIIHNDILKIYVIKSIAQENKSDIAEFHPKKRSSKVAPS